MKRIRSSVRQILVSLFLVYLASLMMATNGCARMTRATWPSTYGWQGLQWATVPWVNAEQLAQLGRWHVAGDHEVRAFLQQSIWGEVFVCAK
jgi:hypothetical protein